MNATTDAGAAMAVSTNENSCPALPDGEYAIVEVLGHRTYVGRIGEVERFGAKLMSVEPLFAGDLLPPILIGGSSIYQFTACTADVARARMPTKRWQLPTNVQATMPPLALSAPDTGDDEIDPDFAPAFLSDDEADDD